MSVFRRSSAGATESKATEAEAEQIADAPAKTKAPAQSGKGRPTPKRSEAERTRYRSIQGGTTSGRNGASGAPARPLTKEEKERQKEDRSRELGKRRQAMQRGEEWALPVRDRGPLKKLARDYVDSHRRVSEYYMWVLVVLLVAMFSQNKTLETYIGPFVFALIVIIVVDAFFITRALRKLVAVRYPGQSTRGLTWYSVMRAMQIRRFRMPAPAVKPGDRI
jgi:hypothetical protein